MPRSHRAVVAGYRSAPIESLESRTLLSGGPGPGDHHNRLIVNVQQFSATGDFNADGKADLITVEKVSAGKFTQSSLVLQLGRGNGLFVASAARVMLGSPSAVVVGDFNGDGKADAALISPGATATDTKVTILAGDGKGRLAAPVTQSVGALPADNITAGYINGDGYSDLLSFNDTQVFESLNDGAGNLLPATQQDNPFPGANPVAAGDMDADGRPELIGVSGDQILFNRALASDGTYIQTVLPTFGSDLSLTNKRLLVGDVNGDGINDLIAVGDGSVSVALRSLTSTTTDFLPWVTSNADVDPAKVAVGDINGDGKADLFRPGANFGFFAIAKLVLISNGDGTFHKLLF